MHTGIAGVLLERNDLAGAAEHLQAGEQLGEYLGLPQDPYRRRVVAARLSEAQGDLDTALELLDEAVLVYNGDYSPNVQPVRAVRARLLMRRGELAAAESWVNEAGVSDHDDLSYLHEYEHVTLARVLLARHQAAGDRSALDLADTLLTRLRGAAGSGGRVASEIEILVLISLTRQAQGDRLGALDALGDALDLANPEGYVRLLADERPKIEPLLRLLGKEDRRDSAQLSEMLAATEVVAAPILAAQGQNQLIEPLSDREVDVLRLLGTDLSGPEIARELHVSLNTLRTHTRNIFRKLQVTNRRAAIRRAAELDLSE
jgi:LuxR family maltose regulon positive regulatory protein